MPNRRIKLIPTLSSVNICRVGKVVMEISDLIEDTLVKQRWKTLTPDAPCRIKRQTRAKEEWTESVRLLKERE